MNNTYELYLHTAQEYDVTIAAKDIEAHLIKTGLVDRAQSVESELVKGWITNPDTYPEELRWIQPVLWGRVRQDGYSRLVKYLYWDGRLKIGEVRTKVIFIRSRPALLAKDGRVIANLSGDPSESIS